VEQSSRFGIADGTPRIGKCYEAVALIPFFGTWG